mgnify:FL=1
MKKTWDSVSEKAEFETTHILCSYIFLIHISLIFVIVYCCSLVKLIINPLISGAACEFPSAINTTYPGVIWNDTSIFELGHWNLKQPSNHNYSGPWYPQGTQIEVTCEPNTHLLSYSIIECTGNISDARWNGSLPVCESMYEYDGFFFSINKTQYKNMFVRCLLAGVVTLRHLFGKSI